VGKALLAAVGLVAGAFMVRGAIQRAGRAKAHLAEGIDEKIWIGVGGIDQWVTIRGRDLANPLLLVLHGGPGAALSVLAGKLFPGWDEHFTVVNWDQRGAGRTLGRNGKAGCGKLTIGRMVTDGIELAEDLRRRFPGRPLVLLGISWGSLLGVEMVRARPDLFAAYVGAGQVVDMGRGEQLSYFGAIDRLRAKGEERGAQALEGIGPPPYPSIKALAKQRKLLISTMPKAERNVFRRVPLQMLLAPDATLRDLVNLQAGAKFSIVELWRQLMDWRLADGGYELGVPVTIIQGDLDLQTPTALVTEVAAKLNADLVIIEGAAHMALVTHGDEVLKALVKRARPAAKKPRKKKP